ncbi:MAG: hypothetical protein JO034_31830 [Singulisphaera sp.]|nr:hypothetical protein [Singulisphaera sp.]
MNVTPGEFEVRVEAVVAGLPAPAAARAELLAWARASIVELEAHLDEVEEFQRRDRELAVEEALFDGGPSGAARLRAELAQDRVLRTALQEVGRLQRERAEAAAAGATDRAAGSADPAAPTEAIYERGEVKRAGADSVSREPPHIPLAVGVGRSGPSQTPPTVPGRATPGTHPLSPRSRESPLDLLTVHEPVPT